MARSNLVKASSNTRSKGLGLRRLEECLAEALPRCIRKDFQKMGYRGVMHLPDNYSSPIPYRVCDTDANRDRKNKLSECLFNHFVE